MKIGTQLQYKQDGNFNSTYWVNITRFIPAFLSITECLPNTGTTEKTASVEISPKSLIRELKQDNLR